MTIEIERKFILSDAPSAERLGLGVRIRQGYLAEQDGVEVRLGITSEITSEIISEEATFTVKAGTGLTRTEVEIPISAEAGDALWPHTTRRRTRRDIECCSSY